MKIGITSFIFYDWDLETTCKYVSDIGYEAIELDIRPGQKHLLPNEVLTGKAMEIKSLIKKYNLIISALSCGVNHLDPDLKRRKELNDYFKQVIEAASLLEVPVVTGISGFPAPEKTEEQNWKEFEQEMGAIIDLASEREVKVALETFPPALVYNNSTIEKMLSVIPSKYLGWNLDPSHQVYQFIDYLESIRAFKDRIFHVHAKDTEILHNRLRFTGIYGEEWWRFRIPGFGDIEWRKFISCLEDVGYDYVVSFEHEDPLITREDAVPKALLFLRSIVYRKTGPADDEWRRLLYRKEFEGIQEKYGKVKY